MNKDIEYATFFADLPSEGRLYSPESSLSEGTVEMRFGSAQEEGILMNVSYIQKRVVFDKLLKALIVNPTIDINDLIVGDKNALLVAARRAMYGDTYKAKVTCPRCGEPDIIKLDLSELESFKLKKDIASNTFTMTTPNNFEIKYHLLTGSEINDIEMSKRKMKKLGIFNKVNELLERLKRSIDSINGETDKLKIKEILESHKFSSIDSRAIREDMLNNSPDIDLSHMFSCSECDFEDVIDIPIDTNFFWSTGRKRTRTI